MRKIEKLPIAFPQPHFVEKTIPDIHPRHKVGRIVPQGHRRTDGEDTRHSHRPGPPDQEPDCHPPQLRRRQPGRKVHSSGHSRFQPPPPTPDIFFRQDLQRKCRVPAVWGRRPILPSCADTWPAPSPLPVPQGSYESSTTPSLRLKPGRRNGLPSHIFSSPAARPLFLAILGIPVLFLPEKMSDQRKSQQSFRPPGQGFDS